MTMSDVTIILAAISMVLLSVGLTLKWQNRREAVELAPPASSDE